MLKTRIFSNHNEITYGDYISKKTSCLKPKKINARIKPIPLTCDKSPMKITDSPTSYICSNNIHNLIPCKNVKGVLYPYGKYRCIERSCNTITNIGQRLEAFNSVDAGLNTNQSSTEEYSIFDLFTGP